MNANTVLASIKKRQFKPIYLLHGEEPYYIDFISNYIEKHALSDAEKGFNQTILYGKDTDAVSIVNAAKRYPMMSDYQVIIVKEAQNLKWDKGEGKADDLLLKYLEQPLTSTILVICYKYAKFDKRKKLYKVAEQVGVVLESAKIYADKVGPWIDEWMREQGRHIQPRASALMGEYLGTDLSKVVNELEKLMLNVAVEREITVSDVENNIGISKDFNVFELNTALAHKDVFKANQIIDYFGDNPKANPFVVILGAISTYFVKVLKYHYLSDKNPQNVARVLGVHPFFTKEYDVAAKNFGRWKTFQIISYLREYDLKSKGVNAVNVEQGELLKELIFKILH
ncbi:DNA polymerase III, delta subunit [bacterium A37T11]|nr:DNA polymerase III, delta subunit [bacterium A37T11]